MFEDFDLRLLRPYIDWTPFFRTWGIRGRHPDVLTDPELGEDVRVVQQEVRVGAQVARDLREAEWDVTAVLDMGDPVRIVDLAEDLIHLSGLEVGEDIDIVYTGLRPGEKLFEELGFDPARMVKTLHTKIFVLNLAAVLAWSG